MSDQEKAAAVAKEAEVAKPAVPLRSETTTPALTIDTIWGPVSVFGAHLVSPKFVVVLGEMFKAWDEFRLAEGLKPMHHGVHIIVLRDDDQPKNAKGASTHAHCQSTMGGMAINLQWEFDASLDTSLENQEVSIYANIWYNLITSVGHEMYHLNSMFDDVAFEDEDEEKKAAVFARGLMYFMSQNMYDIEPTPIQEEPYFGQKLLDALHAFTEASKEDGVDMSEKILEEDLAFCKEQKMMALEGIMAWYKDDEETNDQILKSFREYVHWSSGDKLDDPKWVKLYEKPAPVEEAAPAAEPAPVVEVASPAATVVVEQAAPAPVVEHNAYTGETDEVYEVGTDVSMYEEGPPWDVEEQAVMNQTVVAATVAAPAPAAVQPQVPASPAPLEPAPNSSGQAHGLTGPQVGEVCMPVYRKLFNHMFTACEPVKIDNTTVRPDGKGGGCGGFNNLAGIQEPVVVAGMTGVDKVIVQMDAIIEGTWTKGAPIVGTIFGGKTGVASLLPKYDLYVITHEGHMEKRSLIPQNPWKTHKKCAAPGCKQGNLPTATACKKCGASLAGIEVTFTKPALEAQAGKRILYVYAPNNVMKCKLLAQQDASGNWKEWVEDANWNVIG